MPELCATRGLSVLVVDDHADTAESEMELLATRGHAVRTALSGADALRCAADERPDVVLLDLCMPGMDGCELARRLRAGCAGGRQPVIVAVTGCGGNADRDQAADSGCDLHLLKPVEPAALLELLDRLRRLLTAIDRG